MKTLTTTAGVVTAFQADGGVHIGLADAGGCTAISLNAYQAAALAAELQRLSDEAYNTLVAASLERQEGQPSDLARAALAAAGGAQQ